MPHRLWVLLAALAAPACAGPSRAAAKDKPAPRPPAKPPLIVVLDPGHGGRDRGAVIRGNKDEKDIVLAVAKRLRDILEEAPGISPYLTRWEDDFVPLSDRVFRAQQVGGKVFVSLHADNVRGRRGRGVVVYVYGRNRGLPKGPPRQVGEVLLPPPPAEQVRRSRGLADTLRRALARAGIRSAAHVDRGAFAVLKSRDIPSVLVEIGNLRDPGEAQRLADPEHQEQLARALARGIRRHLGASEADLAAR